MGAGELTFQRRSALYLGYRRLRYEFRNLIASSPALYFIAAQTQPKELDGPALVTPDTDLVMEAFPRSGNTFAYFALQKCQPSPLKIAHHFHAPAQLIAAARWNRPALLIIRNPVDAVCSFIQREQVVTARQSLRAWIRFHEALLPYRSSFMVATFDQVTADFGSVIQRLNTRFGTDFYVFHHTPKNVDECFHQIEARNAARFGNGKAIESGVARPSAKRAIAKRPLLEELASQSVRKRREHAEALFMSYAEQASRKDSGQ